MARIEGKAEVYELEAVTVLDRITLNDGSTLTQATVNGSEIELIVYGSDGTEVDFVGLATNEVIFDALQVDDYWEGDGTGYNFRHTYDTANVPLVGGRTYRLVYIIPTVGFGSKYVVLNLTIRDLEAQTTT